MGKEVDLKDSCLFRGLDEGLIAAVQDICRLVRYRPGEVVFDEGDPAEDICILRSGRVEITNHLKLGSERVQYRITSIQPGEIFAWSALAGSVKLTARANAIEPCEVIRIPGPELKSILEREPRLGYPVMHRIACLVASRLRDTRAQVRDLLQSR